MTYDDIVEDLKSRVGVESREEVRETLDATVRTLGECLPVSQRRVLASQLPVRLAEAFPRRRDFRPVRLEEFFQRVRARTDVGYREAIRRSRAVVAVLRKAAGDSALEQLRHSLPREYEQLFEEGAETESVPRQAG